MIVTFKLLSTKVNVLSCLIEVRISWAAGLNSTPKITAPWATVQGLGICSFGSFWCQELWYYDLPLGRGFDADSMLSHAPPSPKCIWNMIVIMIMISWQVFLAFLGWLSDPLRGQVTSNLGSRLSLWITSMMSWPQPCHFTHQVNP